MHSVVANLLSRLNDEVFVYTPPPSGSGPKPVVTLTPGASAKPAGGTLEEVRAVDYHEAWVQCTSAWHCLPAPNHLHHHRQPCPLMPLCHLWMITVLWPCFVGVRTHGESRSLSTTWSPVMRSTRGSMRQATLLALVAMPPLRSQYEGAVLRPIPSWMLP
jgi:hypothetical protein